MTNILRRIFGPKASGSATPAYKVGPRFDGEGAAAFEYLAQFSLPIVSFRGNARLAGSRNVLQHPQVYYIRNVPNAGMGGLIAGTPQLQPLVTQKKAK